MTKRNNLVATATVDKNGKNTTVHKRPEMSKLVPSRVRGLSDMQNVTEPDTEENDTLYQEFVKGTSALMSQKFTERMTGLQSERHSAVDTEEDPNTADFPAWFNRINDLALESTDIKLGVEDAPEVLPALTVSKAVLTKKLAGILGEHDISLERNPDKIRVDFISDATGYSLAYSGSGEMQYGASGVFSDSTLNIRADVAEKMEDAADYCAAEFAAVYTDLAR